MNGFRIILWDIDLKFLILVEYNTTFDVSKFKLDSLVTKAVISVADKKRMVENEVELFCKSC